MFHKGTKSPVLFPSPLSAPVSQSIYISTPENDIMALFVLKVYIVLKSPSFSLVCFGRVVGWWVFLLKLNTVFAKEAIGSPT